MKITQQDKMAIESLYNGSKEPKDRKNVGKILATVNQALNGQNVENEFRRLAQSVDNNTMLHTICQRILNR